MTIEQIIRNESWQAAHLLLLCILSFCSYVCEHAVAAASLCQCQFFFIYNGYFCISKAKFLF